MPSRSTGEARNTLASVIAVSALILFLPAVSLPFLRIERLGHASENTLVEGVVSLFLGGRWFLATVVLLFSLVLPPLKLLALLVLSHRPAWMGHRHRALTYRMIEHLGRWGMLDVLFVAVLLAFIKLGDLMQFTAGAGLPAFGIFVLLSLCATCAFDPHALWNEAENSAKSGASGSGTPTENSMPSSQATTHEVPATAAVRRQGRLAWLWLIPVLVLLGLIPIAYRAWMGQGPSITITFSEGHGLKPDDAVRYRGIVVGRVEHVVLAEDLRAIEARVRLTPEAEGLARRGSRFWIVRPEIDLSGIRGLETVLGANYIAVSAGSPNNPPQRQFTGLEEPPLPEALATGGLDVVVQTTDASGLRAGTRVFYRQLPIGILRRVSLASDSSAVEAHLVIRGEYRHLIRTGTKFWNADGVRLQGGFDGFSLHVGSLETVIHGGIAIAVPPEPGETVEDGHRFQLHPTFESEWLHWRPPLESTRLPEKRPEPVRAVLQWQEEGWIWDADRKRNGWLLPVPQGVLGPADLLELPRDASPGSAALRLAGHKVEFSGPPEPRGNDLAFRAIELDRQAWPAEQRRVAKSLEDTFLVVGSPPKARFVAAVRYSDSGGSWRLDENFPVEKTWHGAPVIAAEDNALLGFLLVEDGRGRVALLRE